MSNIFPALLFPFDATGLSDGMKKNPWKAKNSKGILLFILAPHKPTAVCQTRGERGREGMEKRERVTKTEKERKRGLGHYHPYYSSLKRAIIEAFVCVCACTAAPHVHAAACSRRALVRPHAKVTKKEQYNWRNVRSNNRYSENDNSY